MPGCQPENGRQDADAEGELRLEFPFTSRSAASLPHNLPHRYKQGLSLTTEQTLEANDNRPSTLSPIRYGEGHRLDGLREHAALPSPLSNTFDFAALLEDAHHKRRNVSGHEPSDGEDTSPSTCLTLNRNVPLPQLQLGLSSSTTSSVGGSRHNDYGLLQYSPSIGVDWSLISGSASVSDRTQAHTPSELLPSRYTPTKSASTTFGEEHAAFGAHLDGQVYDHLFYIGNQPLIVPDLHRGSKDFTSSSPDLENFPHDTSSDYGYTFGAGSANLQAPSLDHPSNTQPATNTTQVSNVGGARSDHQRTSRLLPLSEAFQPATDHEQRWTSKLETPNSQAEQKLISLDNSLTEVLWNSSNGVVGYETKPASKRKAREPYDPETRAQVKKTRQEGSCPGCKQGKKKCSYDSEYGVCKRCGGIPERRLKCKLRVFLEDLNMLRDFENAVDVSDNILNFKHYYDRWPGHDNLALMHSTDQKLVLTQGLGSLTMQVSVRRFNPCLEDSVAYSGYKDGRKWELPMPPYCLYDEAEVKRAANDYIQASIIPYLRNFLHHGRFVQKCGSFLKNAFLIASKSSDSLLEACLTLWVICRLTEKTWYMKPPNTLGVPLERQNNDPWSQKVPVTPIMDQQLDEVLTKRLIPLRNSIRRCLISRMQDHKKASHHRATIIPAIIILLSNLECQNAHERRFCDMYGLSGRFWTTSPGTYPLWQIRHHSANTLLAYYHHYLSDTMALRPSTGNSATQAENSTENTLQNLVTRFRPQLEDLRRLRRENRYEQEMFWIHQMFTPRWSADTDQIVELSSSTSTDETL